MTELEKIAYAKMFIDKLANGINPLDDSKIKDDDLVNNVRLSRCFFYVSDILRQVIDNGGIGKPELNLPFTLTQKEIDKYEYSNNSISITDFCKKLNALTVANMKKITYREISMWLIAKGYLVEEMDEHEKKRRLPSPLGNQLGIHTEVRYGQRGEYLAVLYDKNAQEFILNHIQEIIDYMNKK